MSTNQLPEIPNYLEITENLTDIRENILKSKQFGPDAEDYVRNIDDAKIVLDFLSNFQKNIHTELQKNFWLLPIFENEFLPLDELYDRDYLEDICFIDDCLIPTKEMFYLGQDGSISPKILDLHLETMSSWFKAKVETHHEAQRMIAEEFDTEKKVSDLACPCPDCRNAFRQQLRTEVYTICQSLIFKARDEINENIDNRSVDEIASVYIIMQRKVDKITFKHRYNLKKSTVNKLQNQLKNEIKENFFYPSPLASLRESTLGAYLREYLYNESINEDFFDLEAQKKFFRLLGNQIWKNLSFIVREFKKFLKSIMILKKKDISGTILQEYIGEFWIHSQARTIKRKIIYHMGPTNSGKTYHAIERLAEVERGCYLAPLRLLAAELYDTLNAKNAVTTLLTGEEVIEKEGATHYSSTIEMARLTEYFDACVIDEIQMISDRQRGWAWTRALVNIFAQEVHICGDPSVLELVEQIVELCGDELIIKKYERMTELNVSSEPVVLGDLKKADALIVFSRRNALRYKRDLEKLNFKVSIVYGRLSPEVRREQARKFDRGETDIMVSTDAIAMGMNLPIQRIIFSTLSKYIDSVEHPITDSEIKQIAGRAGRYQRFPVGHTTCLTKVEEGIETISYALSRDLEQREKCMVGPDLDIYKQVNEALEGHGLSRLKLSEFLRLFNTMNFQKPFYCVSLKEMIELAEMVEDADPDNNLTSSEVFGFACAPVNLGLVSHVQYFSWILNRYVDSLEIPNEKIDAKASDIDYLETSIKSVELYQWLSRHFHNKNFEYDEEDLLDNKSQAVEKLNALLSEKIVLACSSCGVKLAENAKFNICEKCFKERRFGGRRKTGGKAGDKGNSRSKKKTFRRDKNVSRKRRSTTKKK